MARERSGERARGGGGGGGRGRSRSPERSSRGGGNGRDRDYDRRRRRSSSSGRDRSRRGARAGGRGGGGRDDSRDRRVVSRDDSRDRRTRGRDDSRERRGRRNDSRDRDRDRDHRRDSRRGDSSDRRRDDSRDDRRSDRRDDRRRDDSRDRTPPRTRAGGDDRGRREGSRDAPAARRARSRSMSTASSDGTSSEEVRRRHAKEERRQAKAAEKMQKRAMKEASKAGKQQGEYMSKVGKGLGKMLEASMEAVDKGRPLSLLRAAFASALRVMVEIQKKPDDPTLTRIPLDDERLLYLRSVDYGLELMLRLGFEELKPPAAPAPTFELRAKYRDVCELSVEMLKDVLVSATQKLHANIPRLEASTVGPDDLSALLGTDAVSHATLRAVGVALGACGGDVLGLPVCNWSRTVIERWFGRLTEFHALPPATAEGAPASSYWRRSKPKEHLGRYSGDFAVAVSTALSTVQHGRIDCRHYPSKVAGDASAYLQHGKLRMHTEALEVLIGKLRNGEDPRRIGLSLSPSGLHGSEGPALMPFVALCCFQDDETKQPDDAAVLDAVKAALLPFIVHADGVGCAFVFVCAVHYLLRQRTPDEFRASLFLKHVREKADLVQMSAYLRRCLRLMEEHYSADADAIDEGFLEEVQEDLRKASLSGVAGTDDEEEESDTCYTTAVGAVVVALYCLVNNAARPLMAVSDAVGFGEAAHHLGSMTGALCGALHGAYWVPQAWFGMLENGDGMSVAGYGRDRVLQLAIDCAALEQQAPKHYEAPLEHVARTYRGVAAKKEATEEEKAAASAPPEADPGTDALVAAMPISMRKFYVDKK